MLTVGISLADGDRLVIGGSAEAWVDVVWTGLSLGNGADGVEFYAGSVALDGLSWDGGPTLALPAGASLSLDPWYGADDENDDPDRWCAATVPWRGLGATDAGSPGAENEPCTTIDHDGDGVTMSAGDCDDDDANTYLGAPDVWYGGRNTDCDGWSDYDADRNGFDAVAFGGGDCDDGAFEVNPAAPEICDAANTDEDCDGAADALDSAPTDAATWYFDADGDGYGDATTATAYCDPPARWSTSDEDCDGSTNGCGLGGEVDLADADAVITGVSSNDAFGASVAFAGDLDGDGTMDLVVGASGASRAGRGAGSAKVFLGGLSGSLSARDADRVLSGESATDAAGSDVDGVGDVDGDGVLDLLVAAPGDDTTATDAGAAYLVSSALSGAQSLSARTAILVGSAANEQAGGYYHAALGDVDADGLGDMAIGAPGADGGGSDAGVVYVVYGRAFSGTFALSGSDALLVAEDAGDQSGYGVCAAGDLDGDGTDDVLVMARGDDDGGTDAGAAYVVYLPISGTFHLSASDAKITGPSASSLLSTCAGLGDVDGDGRDDFAVGSSAVDGSTGAAYVSLEAPVGRVAASSADVTIAGIASGDAAGSALGAAGDVDADGTRELLVGASGVDTGRTDAGAVYLWDTFVAGACTLSSAETLWYGAGFGDGLKVAVGGGDHDGDGYDDVLIGSSSDDTSTSGAGAAYLYHGGPGF